MNAKRISAAKHYLSQLSPPAVLKHFKKLEQKENIDMAIGIVTISRKHDGDLLGYLPQVVTRFMYLFEGEKRFKNKALFICNADPGKHEEAEELSKYVPSYDRYTEKSDSESNSKFEKEKRDYVFCINQALTYKPQYVVIIEDDAIPHMDLFKVLHYALHNLVENKYVGDDHAHNTLPWAYLKLYYPERWQGFSNEPKHILELIGCSTVLGAVFLYLIRLVDRRHIGSPIYYYILGCIYFALVVLLVGRQYLIELRRIAPSLYTVIDAPDCCSPAILYPAKKAAEMAEYLSSVSCSQSFPIDFAMDKFATTKGYKRYLIEPSLAKHIGFYSSIKSVSKNPMEFIFWIILKFSVA